MDVVSIIHDSAGAVFDELTRKWVISHLTVGSSFIHIWAVGSKRRIFCATECVLAVQGHSGSSKVYYFGTNRKRVCDFLLVISSNCGLVLHSFLLAKNCLFLLPATHSALLLLMFPLAFRAVVNHQDRVMGLSCSEDTMIVAVVVLTQSQHMTVRGTEGQTDGFTIANTVLSIASYADEHSKLCWHATRTILAIDIHTISMRSRANSSR